LRVRRGVMEKSMHRLVSFGAVLAVATAPVCAEIDLPRIQGVFIHSQASMDPETNLVQYIYAVDHQGPDLKVLWFKLDISSDESRESLSSNGLDLDDHFINADIGIGPFVPSYSPSAPERWRRALTARREIKWATIRDQIPPGESRSPFVLVSPGLPGIRTAKFEADLWKFLPLSNTETGISPEEISQAIDAAALHVRTIGPVAPPASFTASGFLSEILQLRADAEAEGWIRSGSGVASVDTLLQRLGKDIAAENWAAAERIAERAAQEVEKISCADFACAPTIPMTAEARALLAVNLRYLGSRLPTSADPPTAIVNAIRNLPDEAFKGRGNRTAMLAILEAANKRAATGDIDQALKELAHLRERLDGCGPAADSSDWIVECGAQLTARSLLDLLIANP